MPRRQRTVNEVLDEGVRTGGWDKVHGGGAGGGEEKVYEAAAMEESEKTVTTDEGEHLT